MSPVSSSSPRRQSLIRASDFCRPRNPPTIDVLVAVRSSERRRNDQWRCASDHHHQGHDDDCIVVDVPVNLLLRLSVKHGDIAWLQCDRSSSPLLLRRLAVKVRACSEDDTSTRIRIPPTVAACIGFYYSKDNNNYCTMQAYSGKSLPPTASTVTVWPLGRPVASSSSTTSFRTANDATTVEYPNLESSERRLLTRGGLVFKCDSQTSNELFLFQVAGARTFENDGSSPLVFYVTSETKYELEPFPADQPIPRLGCLSDIRNYLLPQDKRTKVPPHPSVEQLSKALLIPSSAPPSHKIIHIIGTEENHVNVCVAAAADRIGMRCLSIRGLAAFAHNQQHTVSTGGLVDQLNGCQEALKIASQSRPCVLHFCEFDKEFSKEDESMRHMQEQRFYTCMIDALAAHDIGSNDEGGLSTVPAVLVAISTARPLITGPLRHHLVFPSLSIQSPDEKYSRYIWDDDNSFEQASPHLVGRSAREIVLLRRQFQAHGKDISNLESFCVELDAKQRTISTRIPSVQWRDVGGLAYVRSEIMDAIELPLRHARLFPKSLGGRTGILLYGPPGSGKTLVAKAVATECGLPFLSVKGPELLGSYVGESEANVRAIFAEARQAAIRGHHASNAGQPAATVLFFDELDSLAPRRGGLGDGGGVMDRVVATLLTELDGRQSEDTESSIVFVIGATNRPDLLDPSLLRPGRLDRLVYLGLATSSKDRAQILAASIRKFSLDPQDPMAIAQSVVDRLPVNLSGADFAAIASGALMKSLDRVCSRAEAELERTRERTKDPHIDLDTILDNWDEGQLTAIVTPDDLIEAGKAAKPSVNEEELADYERLRTQFNCTEHKA
jgi:AAA+ superfamily predicted ATPase